MKQIRIVLWVVFLVAFAAFVAMNWTPARVNFWPLSDGYLHFDWPVGFTALVFFLVGFVPAWATGRWRRWRLKRRINTLETTLTNQPQAALTTTQLEAAAQAMNETP